MVSYKCYLNQSSLINEALLHTGDLAASIRAKQPHVHFGLYHSLFEWFNPLYLKDKTNHFQTNNFVTQKTLPELFDLVSTKQLSACGHLPMLKFK